MTIDNKTDLKNFIKDEKLLESYEIKLLNLSNDKEYCKEYMNENIERNLENERLYRLGERDGELQQLEKTVLTMYQNNVSLNLISLYNGVSLEEVKKIIDNYKEDANN